MGCAVHRFTEGSAIVELDHGGPLVRVEEVDDGDGEADHEAEGPGDDDEPEAPAELKGELERFWIIGRPWPVNQLEDIRTCTSSM